jgi:hypothetical protein
MGYVLQQATAEDSVRLTPVFDEFAQATLLATGWQVDQQYLVFQYPL